MKIEANDVSVLRDAFYEYATPNADGQLVLSKEAPFGTKYVALDILDSIDFDAAERGMSMDDSKEYALRCFAFMLKEMALADSAFVPTNA